MSQTLASSTLRRSSTAAPPVRGAGRPAARAPRPDLRVVLAPSTDRGRTAFLVGCLLLLMSGLIGLLLVNTALAQGSFALHDLQQQSAELGDQEQALRQQIDVEAAPARLAWRAHALGMVPSQSPAFLRLGDDRVLGVAEAAQAPPAPTVKTTPHQATTPTAAASKKPSATARPATRSPAKSTRTTSTTTTTTTTR